MRTTIIIFTMLLILLTAGCGRQTGIVYDEAFQTNDTCFITEIPQYNSVSLEYLSTKDDATEDTATEDIPTEDASSENTSTEDIPTEVYTEDEPSPPLSAIPLDYAARFFAEFDALHTEDNGELWGVYLHTPFIFVDPDTRNIVANRPDPQGILVKEGDVYIGVLPDYLPPLYNARLYFGGKYWAVQPWGMVNNRSKVERLRSMSHLGFHWLQPIIFDMTYSYNNSHLETMEGRISILLETNALLRAFNHRGDITDDASMQAITDALSIRTERRRIFGRAEYENKHEIVEGTAQYTEYRLNFRNEHELRREVELFSVGLIDWPSLVHPFGYVTGALYALLLDETGVPWKHRITGNTDLGALLQEVLGISQLPLFEDIDLSPYGYVRIARRETERQETHQRMVEGVIDAFITQPVLRTPPAGAGVFNGHVFPFEEWGESARLFRGRVEIHCDFGSLILRHGDLLLYDGITILASGIVIEEGRAFGRNWELELNEGFAVIPDGDNFVVVRE